MPLSVEEGDRVVVIGAGLGGLAAAIRLASDGRPVTVCEQHSVPGGKMNEATLGEYRFDTGPSLLTMPFVVDELFDYAGRERRDYVQFDRLPLICRYFFADGAILDADSDLGYFRQNLEVLRRGEGKNFARFMAHTEQIYKATADVFLFTPFHEISRLMKRRYLPALLGLPKIEAMRTVHEVNEEFFDDPRLVQVFDRYATYNGSSPFLAPGTLSVIPYVEYGLGGYYVRGGMYRLVDALVQLAEELGVQFVFNEPVKRILHESGKVVGVEVAGGEVPASAVVSNMDVVETYRQLLPDRTKTRGKLEKLEPSLSGMVFLWGVRGKHDGLAHHNILFSSDYKGEFAQLFETLESPDDPTVYVSITSRADPDHAPEDSENWFVLVNMPYLDDSQDMDEMVEQTRERVLLKLHDHGFDLAGKIETEQVITPKDFYKLYSSNRGSIYGLSSNGRTAAFKRPPNRSRDLKGMYFAGGSVHPGGGIPLTLLSGRMAGELVK